jgi:cardiolipin synthase
LSRFRVSRPSGGRSKRSFDDSFDAAWRAAFETGAARASTRALRRLAKRWRGILRRLAPLGAVSAGNRVTLHREGDALFDALWGEIERARERVLVNTYILAPDRVGRATVAALARAAERGCAVMLRYDALGSGDVACPELDHLLRVGGRVEAFNPVLTWRSRLSRKMVRDHRKVAVVDGRIAFCGGMNLSEAYAGERHGTGEFRDSHLALEGPVAADLEALFDERAPAEAAPVAGGALVQVLESNRWRKRRAIQRAMRRTISRAGERVWLTTPYFIPPPRLARAIRSAARRGVDVRLLTAGPSDVPFVRAIARHLYASFLRAGVRIFELQVRTLHAKTAVIDRVYSSVGSFNLDVSSDRYNPEVTVGVLAARLAAEVAADFARDVAGAVEVRRDAAGTRSTAERLVGRFGYWLSKLF